MLVNKYEADQIVSFKLVNGDEIVAKLIEENKAIEIQKAKERAILNV